MTPEQRYLFDINGYLHLPDVLKIKHNRHLRWNRKCLSFGEPTGNRTQDLRIKSPVLYQLSYRLYRCCI